MSQTARRRKYYSIIRSIGLFVTVLMGLIVGRRVVDGDGLTPQYYIMIGLAVWALISSYRAHTQLVAVRNENEAGNSSNGK